MKTILAVIGGFALLVFFGFIGLVVYLYFSISNTDGLQEESIVYVDKLMEEYSKEWNPQVLVDYASPELKEVFRANPQILPQMTTIIQTYGGEVVSQEKSRCPVIDVVFTAEEWKIVTAQCSKTMLFKSTRGVFSVNTVKRKDSWQLLGIFAQFVQTQSDGPKAPIEVNIDGDQLADLITRNSVVTAPVLPFSIRVNANEISLSRGDIISAKTGTELIVTGDKNQNLAQ